jgi:catalase
MRIDGNHSGNKQYTPNSFTNKFRPDVAEAPYKVSDNVVSRKSHYYHEGKVNEYTQARDLYQRVMNDTGRKNLHSNTALMLSHVNYPVIAKKYLAQIYNIAPEYAQGVYDETRFKFDRFDFKEVEDMSKAAPTFYKEPMLQPGEGGNLVGYSPSQPFYHV